MEVENEGLHLSLDEIIQRDRIKKEMIREVNSTVVTPDLDNLIIQQTDDLMLDEDDEDDRKPFRSVNNFSRVPRILRDPANPLHYDSRLLWSRPRRLTQRDRQWMRGLQRANQCGRFVLQRTLRGYQPGFNHPNFYRAQVMAYRRKRMQAQKKYQMRRRRSNIIGNCSECSPSFCRKGSCRLTRQALDMFNSEVSSCLYQNGGGGGYIGSSISTIGSGGGPLRRSNSVNSLASYKSNRSMRSNFSTRSNRSTRSNVSRSSRSNANRLKRNKSRSLLDPTIQETIRKIQTSFAEKALNSPMLRLNDEANTCIPIVQHTFVSLNSRFTLYNS